MPMYFLFSSSHSLVDCFMLPLIYSEPHLPEGISEDDGDQIYSRVANFILLLYLGFITIRTLLGLGSLSRGSLLSIPYSTVVTIIFFSSSWACNNNFANMIYVVFFKCVEDALDDKYLGQLQVLD
ncbi:hypothetical protein ACJX0J_009135 [Zea mays]